MKTIIAGSRTINNYNIVKSAIEKVVNSDDGWTITEIVSGGAKGIDSLGERWAKNNDIPIKRFVADWEQYGKAAGPIRNTLMAKYSDCLIAIWDGKSRGTSHMITEAQSLDLRVVVLYEDDLKNSKSVANPMFQKEKVNSHATSTIKYKDFILTYHDDKNMNPPVVNFCVELYKDLMEIKEEK